MSKHLGDFDASTVVYGKFTSFQPSTGAAFVLAGSPALSVYKDNSTTQSTSGVTLTASFDSVTGLNHFAIDTSSDGTFYAAGSFFDIVITTGTVDSVSVVGAVVGSFTLRKNSSLKPATAGRTLVVDASGLADANAVKLGPTGSGTAQTARDIGTSVLIAVGTGTGQINLVSGAVPLVLGWKKNTAKANYPFVMVDSSGVPRTGLTVSATRRIDNGSFSACANAVTEIANGWYTIDFAAADLNGDTIGIRFTATGAQDRGFTVVTTG